MQQDEASFRKTFNGYSAYFFYLKGAGWSFAGPRYFLSPTLEELFYGLLPQAYAEKELIISKELNKKGFNLARRTIAKYRKKNNIPASRER